DPNLMGSRVDNKISEHPDGAHPAAGRRDTGSTQHSTNPGNQFPDTKWFGDVVICTRGQPGDFVILTVSCSEHEDVAVGKCPDLPADLHSVQPRQTQIQYHHIRCPRPCLRYSLNTSMSLGGVKARPHQIAL